MTQWFLEKALQCFPERGLCLKGHGGRDGGPVGPELVLKSAGVCGERGLLCRVLVLPMSLRFSPEMPFMKEMEHLPLCFVHLG